MVPMLCRPPLIKSSRKCLVISSITFLVFRQGQCFLCYFLSLTTLWAWCAASVRSLVSLLVPLDRLTGPGPLHINISSHSSGEPLLSLWFMVWSDTNCCRGQSISIIATFNHPAFMIWKSQFKCIHKCYRSNKQPLKTVNNCKCHTDTCGYFRSASLQVQWTIKWVKLLCRRPLGYTCQVCI